METTLHRQLKEYYAVPGAQLEQQVGNFRIDIVTDDRLIEVQNSGLSSIRSKTLKLLSTNSVEIVKPIVARKRLVKLTKKQGTIKSRRWSPARRTQLDLFHELVYFTKVFPHPRLTLRIPLVEIEEYRFPHRRRWFRGQFKVQDQILIRVVNEAVYRDTGDLRRLLPTKLNQPFDTQHLSEAMQVERWFAQKIAYCLRETGCVRQVGKRGNSLLYKFDHPRNNRAHRKAA